MTTARTAITAVLLISHVTGSHAGIGWPLLRCPITTLRASQAPSASHADAYASQNFQRGGGRSVGDIRLEEGPADFRKARLHRRLDTIDRLDQAGGAAVLHHLRLDRDHQVRPELQRDDVE